MCGKSKKIQFFRRVSEIDPSSEFVYIIYPFARKVLRDMSVKIDCHFVFFFLFFIYIQKSENNSLFFID